MNGKTAKLLRKFSKLDFSKDYGQLKKEWYRLNHVERGKRRKEMKRILRKSTLDVFVPQ